MVLRTYNSKDISIVIGGRALTGLGPDTGCECEFDEDAFTKSVGLKGEVGRSASNNNTGIIRVFLMQTSPDNDYLSALHNADKLNGSGVVNVLVRDANGTTLWESAESWIRKMPNLSMAKEESVNEWVIDVAEWISFTGGNA